MYSNMKKYMIQLLSVTISMLLLLGEFIPVASEAEGSKLRIVTTIFPVYDWVREILGDEADETEITMLLDSGADLHNYQPSASDILKIKQADLFIYIGGESDKWAEGVIAVADNPERINLNLMDALGEDLREEETVEGMEAYEEHEDAEKEAEYDEHIWLSLQNARKLVEIIAEKIAEKKPDRRDLYQANAEQYAERLSLLNQAYEEAVSTSTRKILLFGDRFPFLYLTEDYGLTYFAAFSGCSAESEASFETIMFLAKKADELALPVILTLENPKTGLAETIARSTKTGSLQILSMNSLQSITAQDVNSGITYLSVMNENLNTLKQALQ